MLQSGNGRRRMQRYEALWTIIGRLSGVFHLICYNDEIPLHNTDICGNCHRITYMAYKKLNKEGCKGVTDINVGSKMQKEDV